MELEESSEDEDEDKPVAKQRRELQARDARGRFMGLPWEQRPLIYGQLGRRVPPTAIAANIVDVLMVYAREKVVPMPCLQVIRRMRGELTVAGEALAAFRVALAHRVVSFGFDESTKFGMGLLSTNTQIEPRDAPGTTIDVVQRGACLTAGGTAEEIVKSIDEKIFAHSRRLLSGWWAEHIALYGQGSWEADGGPSPDSIGLHRLTLVLGLLERVPLIPRAPARGRERRPSLLERLRRRMPSQSVALHWKRARPARSTGPRS